MVAAEAQAAMVVRRAIQKVRIATPESFDGLEKELANILEEKVSDLGEQLGKLQDEADKGLEVARKRIETIQERRKKEEEKTARPRELMKELVTLVEGLEVDTMLLKDSISDPSSLTMDSVASIEGAMEELGTQVKGYAEATSAFILEHGAEMRATTANLPIAQEYAALIEKVAATRRGADLVTAEAKKALVEIKVKGQKEKLDAMKPELQEQLNEVDSFVKAAESDLLALETIVFPFSRGKKMTEAETRATFDEFEGALGTTSASIEEATNKSAPEMAESADKAMKDELEAWLKQENRRPRARLGQFKARVARCKQLVKTANAEIDKVKNEDLVVEMKPKLLVQIKSAMDVAHLEASLKELEKKVEPFAKGNKKSVDEMLEIADTVAGDISSFKESMAAARAALFPIDESLSDEVKKILTKFLTVEVKKPLLRLTQFTTRLTRVDNLIERYRKDEAKTRRDALLEELKPEALEKAKNSTGESVLVFEDMVKKAEREVEPFYRGCKAPPSAFPDIAKVAKAAVDAAKAALEDARGETCPIDENLEDEIKEELKAFLKPEIRKSELKIGCLERRLRRCSQLVKSFQADIAKGSGQRVEQVKTVLLGAIRKLRVKEKLSAEDLFNKFIPVDGFVDEDAFQIFFNEAGVDNKLAPEDVTAVFQSYLREGRSQLNKEDFQKLAASFMKVLSTTSLTDSLSIASGKAIKQLKSGQIVEVLEGPKADDGAGGLARVRVKTVAGGSEGWATVKGNAGTIFLKDCNAPPAAKAKA